MQYKHYLQFHELTHVNAVLCAQTKQLHSELSDLAVKIRLAQKKSEELQDYLGLTQEDKKKKQKRANELPHFICFLETCGKRYVSEQSFKLHFQLQHSEELDEQIPTD